MEQIFIDYEQNKSGKNQKCNLIVVIIFEKDLSIQITRNEKFGSVPDRFKMTNILTYALLLRHLINYREKTVVECSIYHNSPVQGSRSRRAL